MRQTDQYCIEATLQVLNIQSQPSRVLNQTVLRAVPMQETQALIPPASSERRLHQAQKLPFPGRRAGAFFEIRTLPGRLATCSDLSRVAIALLEEETGNLDAAMRQPRFDARLV